MSKVPFDPCQKAQQLDRPFFLAFLGSHTESRSPRKRQSCCFEAASGAGATGVGLLCAGGSPRLLLLVWPEPFQGKLRDLTLQDLGLEWKPCNSQDETPSNFKPDDYLPKSCPEGKGMNGING